MNRNPNRRLGSGLLDAEELKSHIFLADIDFNKFLYKKFTPPNLNKNEDQLKNYENYNEIKNEKPFHFSFMEKEMKNNLNEDIANKKKSSERDVEGWSFIAVNNKSKLRSKSVKNLKN